MKLALILGSQGEKLKPRLENIRDNLSIDCYVSVPTFIDTAIKRELIYDRAVVLSTLVMDKIALKDLSSYWKKNCKDTEVVFLCREGTDNELAKSVLNLFLSTNVTTMLVKSTTIQILSESILLDPRRITEKYGIEKYMDVELSDGGVEFKEPVSKVPNVTVEPKVPPVVPVVPKKEKKGLFGGLFGGKKKAKQKQEEITEEKPTEEVTEEKPTEEVIEESPTEEEVEKNSEIDEQSETLSEVEVTTDNDKQLEPEETIEDIATEYSEEKEEDEVSTEKTDVNTVSQVPTEQTDLKEEEKAKEPSSVEIDFGDITFDVPDEMPLISLNLAGVSEVDEEEESLAGAEEQYRNQDTRSVTKVVTKEVVHHIGGTITTTLNSIFNGKTSKTIIVTGDRGSGVTVTAYSLARKFAEKVPVLYFDCDIERHGILSYIDYETFRAYDITMTEGIKRCRDTSIFTNCIVQYDTNLDILTSDFSCDANDNDIEKAGAVVAENALDYGVVIVDCPVSKLHLIPDLVLVGNTVVCMESSKRGVMNMLCGLEDSSLEMRYKRCIISRGMLLATKCNKRIKTQRVIDYADSIFADTGCNWLHMDRKDFNGNLTNELLAEIVEG